MKKIIKITIILILIFISFLQTNKVFANPAEGTDGSGGGGQTSTSNSGSWSDKDIDFWKPANIDIGQNEFNNEAKIVVAAIRGIGIVVSIVALLIIGIRQMTASVEEKVIMKQAMPGYILGAILVISITFLPTIIYNFMQKIN